MGVVFRARQPSVGRVVALKTIRAGIYTNSESILRFHHEAEAIARLEHANVVRLYDFGRRDDLPYYVMEWVAGGSLAKKLVHGPLAFREAAELTRTLAEAIEFAHRKNVLHRDLKPSNVLIAADGTPKIADFGVAKLLDGASDLTQTGSHLGTPSYMAPEQAAGRPKDIGPRTDVYALGA